MAVGIKRSRARNTAWYKRESKRDARGRARRCRAKRKRSPGKVVLARRHSSTDCDMEVATERWASATEIREGEIGCVLRRDTKSRRTDRTPRHGWLGWPQRGRSRSVADRSRVSGPPVPGENMVSSMCMDALAGLQRSRESGASTVRAARPTENTPDSTQSLRTRRPLGRLLRLIHARGF